MSTDGFYFPLGISMTLVNLMKEAILFCSPSKCLIDSMTAFPTSCSRRERFYITIKFTADFAILLASKI